MKQNNEFTLSELRKIINFAKYAEASYSGSNGSDVIEKAQNMIRASVEKTDELSKPHHILERAANEATKHIKAAIEQIKKTNEKKTLFDYNEKDVQGAVNSVKKINPNLVEDELSIDDFRVQIQEKKYEIEVLKLKFAEQTLNKAFDLLDI